MLSIILSTIQTLQNHAESCLKRRKSLTPATKTTITSGATLLAWLDSLLILFMSSQSRSATCITKAQNINAQKRILGHKERPFVRKLPEISKTRRQKRLVLSAFTLQGTVHRLHFFGKSTDRLGLKFLDLLHFLP